MRRVENRVAATRLLRRDHRSATTGERVTIVYVSHSSPGCHIQWLLHVTPTPSNSINLVPVA